jgi:hypothetical protein
MPLAVYDEGIALTEAMRLAEGEVPWRDYDPVYGPLEPLLLAPTTWAFGPQLLALRLLRGACLAGLVAVVAACAWRLGARVGAVAAAGALVLYAGPLAHPVLLPTFASALLLDLAGPDRRRGPLVAAGAVAGVAMLLRLEFGVLALAALLAASVVERLLAPEGAPPWRATVQASLRVGAGALPFALSWVALVLAVGPGRWLAHSRDTRASMPYRELPYPLPPPAELEGFEAAHHWLLFALPLLLAIVAPLALGARVLAARRGTAAPPPRLAVNLTLLLLGLLPYALWRSDESHVFPAFCAGLTLAAAAAVPLGARAMPRLGGLALRLTVAALLLLLLARAATALIGGAAPGSVWSSLSGLRGVRLSESREAAWAELVRVVDRHAGGPDAPVFVGCADATVGEAFAPQHGRVMVNDAFTYVVLGRPVGTRHHCFIPGVTTTAAKQAQIVADLDARGVRVAVLAFGLFEVEPNLSATDPGASVLDDALRDGWRRVAELQPWCVLTRRE